MSSSAVVCNMALGHIGVGKPIATLDSDQSQEGEILRVFYTIAFKKVMRDFAWPFAKISAPLSLVSTNPNTEWGYAYRYPADCLYFRRILSGIRNDNRQSRVSYLFGTDSQGKLIYTDVSSAVGEYTSNTLNEDNWDSDFMLAFSYALGELISPRLAKGDPFKLGQMCGQKYMMEIEKAKANAFNEQQAEEDPDSEYIRVRE